MKTINRIFSLFLSFSLVCLFVFPVCAVESDPDDIQINRSAIEEIHGTVSILDENDVALATALID